ncbi:Uu.00g069830.m01.CDS01 [Anthostomella pinea]|uniref:Uu.00g069830.m01.CDS01 n=1 Tax=Anthostomella pinea TaxID=933095 RepID=A0AAI8YNK5_9PEZI|nr:Uu.00g069830.m01.CDS01 [Anthostomella pinea]
MSISATLKAQTRQKGVDVVLGSSSSLYLGAVQNCIARFGRLVQTGAASAHTGQAWNETFLGQSTTYARADVVEVAEYNGRAFRGAMEKGRAEREGCNLQIQNCDIASEKGLIVLLKRVRGSMPPIRGVVDAAMVPEDLVFERMTYDQWKRAVLPKVVVSRSTAAIITVKVPETTGTDIKPRPDIFVRSRPSGLSLGPTSLADPRVDALRGADEVAGLATIELAGLPGQPSVFRDDSDPDAFVLLGRLALYVNDSPASLKFDLPTLISYISGMSVEGTFFWNGGALAGRGVRWWKMLILFALSRLIDCIPSDEPIRKWAGNLLRLPAFVDASAKNCTSTGFGNELVKKVIAEGDHVVATARNSSKLEKPSGASDSNYLAVDLDVTKKESINAAFSSALKKFGRIDVVVNNAGYGLGGEFESLSENQIRTQIEVNFFGLLDVTRKALETMRDQKPSGGVIQQITSIGGQRGVPLFSIYCASKWAVEGFTEALSHEVKSEWGIKLTCVEPGGFRTDWAGRSMAFGEKKNPAYDHLDAEKTMGEKHGSQAGDPAKGAKAMYELAVMKDPPIRCVIGTDAYAAINGKLDTYRENVKKFEKLSNSTDVDGYKPPS